MANDDNSTILGPEDGKVVLVPGHKIIHKASSEDTDGAYSMVEVCLEGDGPPQHIHKTEDESFYILEGEVNFLVGERTFIAKTGSFVLVPKGTIHTFSRVGQKPAKFLVIYSPAGFEKFFDEAVDLDVSDTESYVANANALAGKYNMEVVGPPLDG